MGKLLIIIAVIVFMVFFAISITTRATNRQIDKCQAKFGNSYTRGYQPLDCTGPNGEKKALRP